MPERDLLTGAPFTMELAAAAGVRPGRIRYLLDTGAIRTVLHGVYVAAFAPDSTTLRARAAVLVMPAHAVVCDRSAAWLHGLDVLDFSELDIAPDLEVVSRGGKDRSQRAGVFGGKRDLLLSEVAMVEGIQVTTPLRTACDIACLRGRYRAIATIDAFRRRYGLTEHDFLRILPRFAKRRGVVQLRELIPLSTDQAESQPESWVRLMIHDEWLPMPTAQVGVDVPNWGRARIENAYEHLRIAVEYDGEEFHTRAEDQAADEARRSALRAAGWVVIVVRKGDLAGPSLDRWIAELRQARQDRMPAYARRYSRGESYRGPRW